MSFPFDLFFDALLFGLMLGCFYAAVSLGLSVSFGLLDVPHVAHPALLIAGSYGAYLLGDFGLDPILSGILLMPLFYLLVFCCTAFITKPLKAEAMPQVSMAWHFSLVWHLSLKLD